MTSMGAQAALAVFLLFIATVKAQDGGVTFWREKVTLTCPGKGIFYDKKKNQLDGTEGVYEFEYGNDKRGLYYCEYDVGVDKEKYYFYVQGKVCADCFELDGLLLLVAIVFDVLLTACMMAAIWRCTKKKNSARLSLTPKAPARSAGRAPPVPSPDYEQLNSRTLSQDTYSVVNRTG